MCFFKGISKWIYSPLKLWNFRCGTAAGFAIPSAFRLAHRFSVFKLSFSLHIRSVCADVHYYSWKPSRRGSFFRFSFKFFGAAVYIENAKEKNGCEHPFWCWLCFVFGVLLSVRQRASIYCSSAVFEFSSGPCFGFESEFICRAARSILSSAFNACISE